MGAGESAGLVPSDGEAETTCYGLEGLRMLSLEEKPQGQEGRGRRCGMLVESMGRRVRHTRVCWNPIRVFPCCVAFASGVRATRTLTIHHVVVCR